MDDINAFLHRHRATDLEQFPTLDEDVLDYIVNETPGTLVQQAAPLPPGGNRVLSYVDVVVREDAPIDRILQDLRRLQSNLLVQPEDGRLTKTFGSLTENDIGCRFRVMPGLSPSLTRQELDHLMASLQALLVQYRDSQKR
jgi:hypothetical protein